MLTFPQHYLIKNSSLNQIKGIFDQKPFFKPRHAIYRTRTAGISIDSYKTSPDNNLIIMVHFSTCSKECVKQDKEIQTINYSQDVAEVRFEIWYLLDKWP